MKHLTMLDKTTNEIFKNVLVAMQDAEEGYSDLSAEQYMALMDAIIKEANTRKANLAIAKQLKHF